MLSLLIFYMEGAILLYNQHERMGWGLNHYWNILKAIIPLGNINMPESERRDNNKREHREQSKVSMAWRNR